MHDSALTLPQLKTELKAEIDRLDVKIDTVKVDLEAKIDRLDVKIDTVKTDLEAKIDRLDVKVDTVKTDLEAKIDGVETRLDAKIDGVKAELETKIDCRTEQILETIRETAEMIDARQARRLHADLEAQRYVLQDKLDIESGAWRIEQTRTRAALDEHVRDDSRHLRPKRAR